MSALYLRPTALAHLANPQFDPAEAIPGDVAVDPAAAAFWCFDRGVVSLTDHVAGQVIAPNGTYPTFARGRLTLADVGNHNGIRTPVDELASETWIIIARHMAAATTTRDILGNLTASNDGGWGLLQQGDTGLRVSTRAALNSIVTLTIPSGVAVGGFYALAIAHQSSSRKYKFRGASSVTTSLTRAISSPLRKIAVGEVFNSNNRSHSVDIAAVAAYSSYLSDTGIETAMDYAIAYVGKRGLSVAG